MAVHRRGQDDHPAKIRVLFEMLCSFDFAFGTGMALERALGVLEGDMLT